MDLLFVLLPGRERLIATSLIYRTVPTCAYIVSILDFPVSGFLIKIQYQLIANRAPLKLYSL